MFAFGGSVSVSGVLRSSARVSGDSLVLARGQGDPGEWEKRLALPGSTTAGDPCACAAEVGDPATCGDPRVRRSGPGAGRSRREIRVRAEMRSWQIPAPCRVRPASLGGSFSAGEADATSCAPLLCFARRRRASNGITPSSTFSSTPHGPRSDRGELDQLAARGRRPDRYSREDPRGLHPRPGYRGLPVGAANGDAEP